MLDCVTVCLHVDFSHMNMYAEVDMYFMYAFKDVWVCRFVHALVHVFLWESMPDQTLFFCGFFSFFNKVWHSEIDAVWHHRWRFWNESRTATSSVRALGRLRFPGLLGEGRNGKLNSGSCLLEQPRPSPGHWDKRVSNDSQTAEAAWAHTKNKRWCQQCGRWKDA